MYYECDLQKNKTMHKKLQEGDLSAVYVCIYVLPSMLPTEVLCLSVSCGDLRRCRDPVCFGIQMTPNDRILQCRDTAYMKYLSCFHSSQSCLHVLLPNKRFQCPENINLVLPVLSVCLVLWYSFWKVYQEREVTFRIGINYSWKRRQPSGEKSSETCQVFTFWKTFLVGIKD